MTIVELQSHYARALFLGDQASAAIWKALIELVLTLEQRDEKIKDSVDGCCVCCRLCGVCDYGVARVCGL